VRLPVDTTLKPPKHEGNDVRCARASGATEEDRRAEGDCCCLAWLGLAKSQIREQIEKTKRRNKRRRDVSWLVVLVV